MPNMRRAIPYGQKDLESMFFYDAASGLLRWRVRPESHFSSLSQHKSWNRRMAGAVAGTRRNGSGKVYIQIAISGRFFPAHRLIWIIQYGSFDESLEIDHLNGEGTDNRLKNLRLVSHQENQKNLTRRDNSVSGTSGITWEKSRRKWLVRGYVSGRQRNLGRFDDLEDAVAERHRHEKENGYHELHGMCRQEKAAAA